MVLVTRTASNVAFQLVNKKYPKCKYSMKEILVFNRDVNLFTNSKSTSASNKAMAYYYKADEKFKYLSKEYIDNEIEITIKLFTYPFFLKFYTHFEVKFAAFSKCDMIMKFVEK